MSTTDPKAAAMLLEPSVEAALQLVRRTYQAATQGRLDVSLQYTSKALHDAFVTVKASDHPDAPDWKVELAHKALHQAAEQHSRAITALATPRRGFDQDGLDAWLRANALGPFTTDSAPLSEPEGDAGTLAAREALKLYSEDALAELYRLNHDSVGQGDQTICFHFVSMIVQQQCLAAFELERALEEATFTAHEVLLQHLAERTLPGQIQKKAATVGLPALIVIALLVAVGIFVQVGIRAYESSFTGPEVSTMLGEKATLQTLIQVADTYKKSPPDPRTITEAQRNRAQLVLTTQLPRLYDDNPRTFCKRMRQLDTFRLVPGMLGGWTNACGQLLKLQRKLTPRTTTNTPAVRKHLAALDAAIKEKEAALRTDAKPLRVQIIQKLAPKRYQVRSLEDQKTYILHTQEADLTAVNFFSVNTLPCTDAQKKEQAGATEPCIQEQSAADAARTEPLRAELKKLRAQRAEAHTQSTPRKLSDEEKASLQKARDAVKAWTRAPAG